MRAHPVVGGRVLRLGDRVRTRFAADGYATSDASAPRLEGEVTTIRVRCWGRAGTERRWVGRVDGVDSYVDEASEQVWISIDDENYVIRPEDLIEVLEEAE